MSSSKIDVNPVVESGLSISTTVPRGLRINIGNGLSAGANKIWAAPNLSSGIKVDSLGIGVNIGRGLSASGNQLGAKPVLATGLSVDTDGLKINYGYGLETSSN